MKKQCNKDGYNNVVGLTAYETKLALKKMKKIRTCIKNRRKKKEVLNMGEIL